MLESLQYFHPSFLARLYLEDAGHEQVHALAAQCEIACNIQGRAELMAHFHHGFCEGRYGARAYAELRRQFESDNRERAITWLPLGEAELDLIEKTYARLPAAVKLHASDAIHLASAKLNGFREIHAAELQLLEIAPRFGLKGVDL